MCQLRHLELCYIKNGSDADAKELLGKLVPLEVLHLIDCSPVLFHSLRQGLPNLLSLKELIYEANDRTCAVDTLQTMSALKTVSVPARLTGARMEKLAVSLPKLQEFAFLRASKTSLTSCLPVLLLAHSLLQRNSIATSKGGVNCTRLRIPQ